MAIILQQRETWSFPTVKDDPAYVACISPLGLVQISLHKDTAGMYLMMYEVMLGKVGPKIANEFMQGFVYGCTHMMMYRDKYPGVQLIKNPDGSTTIRMTDKHGVHEARQSDVITPHSHDIDKLGKD